MGKRETIGQRLRRLRLERGLSQRDVSSPGVSYAYISRIERGKRRPSVAALRKLAGKLGVSPDYLETGEQPFAVRVDPPGWRAQAALPEDAVHLARDMLDRARSLGHRVPEASFYGPDGRLVRARVTRTDLATDLGLCWCGRGALYGYPRPGEAFCCDAHGALWQKMTEQQRAKVVVARFISIFGGDECRTSTRPSGGGRRAQPAPASTTSRTRNSSRRSAPSGRPAGATRSGATSGSAASRKRRAGGG